MFDLSQSLRPWETLKGLRSFKSALSYIFDRYTIVDFIEKEKIKTLLQEAHAQKNCHNKQDIKYSVHMEADILTKEFDTRCLDRLQYWKEHEKTINLMPDTKKGNVNTDFFELDDNGESMQSMPYLKRRKDELFQREREIIRKEEFAKKKERDIAHLEAQVIDYMNEHNDLSYTNSFICGSTFRTEHA